MTNVTSGSSKRNWDGEEQNNKRHRGSGRNGDYRDKERGRDDPKDWRDVHLGGPTRGEHTTTVDPSKPQGSREPDSRRSSDYRDRHSRRDDRSRDRHPRDKVRERERQKDRERDRDRPRRDRYREEYKRDGRSSQGSLSPPKSNGQPSVAPPVDDEREEGEISPRPVSNHSQIPPPSTHPPNGNGTNLRSSNSSVNKEAAAQPEAEVELAPEPTNVEDILAAKRARRAAILAKYQNDPSVTATPTGLSVSATPDLTRATSVAMSVDETPVATCRSVSQETVMDVDAIETPTEAEAFELAKEDEQNAQQEASLKEGGEQISAADYDPSKDRREDEHKRLLGENPHKHEVVVVEEELEGEEEEEVDDIFAVALGAPTKKLKKVKKTTLRSAPALITTTALLDTAADAEGYYSVILGEQLDGSRYQVVSSLGKGMFANVVRALVLAPPPENENGTFTEVGKEVAIKIIRSQESMYKAGLKEGQILQKIRQADPEDKKHIVRLERTFEHRGHLCLVFESLSMNLRDVVKRFGKDVGLNISAVRTYAHQLFLALSHLKKLNIMHADIKPDNILVNERKNVLKLCDLGSASDASENDITPYLVSRFYRAPEIILGVPYDPSLDVWSIGCTLYELYTAKILFPGRTNNHMILLMMELKGRFNGKVLKKAKFGNVYFDDLGAFESIERDKVTGAESIKKVHISKPARDLRSRLMPSSSVKMDDKELKMLTSFIDLLDKCLTLDPARRINPRDALAHPFIRG